MNCKYYLSKTS